MARLVFRILPCIAIACDVRRLQNGEERFNRESTAEGRLRCERTGKTTGTPPLMAFLPSMWALELNQRFSLPLFFHEMTVAPYSITSTESPLGKLAVTFLPSEWTVGWGPVVLGERAEGLCALSTILLCVAGVGNIERKMSKGFLLLELLFVPWWGC